MIARPLRRAWSRLRPNLHRSAKPARDEDAEEKIESRTNVINDHLTQHIVVVRQFTRTLPTYNVCVLNDAG